MTLTPEQLDELETKLRDPHEYPHGIGTRASLHLVAVYRAALAWNEADSDHKEAVDMYNRCPTSKMVGHVDETAATAKAKSDALRQALLGAP